MMGMYDAMLTTELALQLRSIENPALVVMETLGRLESSPRYAPSVRVVLGHMLATPADLLAKNIPQFTEMAFETEHGGKYD